MCLILTVVVFSFEQATYTVQESVGVISLKVSLVHGILDRVVQIQLLTQDGSATG